MGPVIGPAVAIRMSAPATEADAAPVPRHRVNRPSISQALLSSRSALCPAGSATEAISCVSPGRYADHGEAAADIRRLVGRVDGSVVGSQAEPLDPRKRSSRPPGPSPSSARRRRSRGRWPATWPVTSSWPPPRRDNRRCPGDRQARERRADARHCSRRRMPATAWAGLGRRGKRAAGGPRRPEITRGTNASHRSNAAAGPFNDEIPGDRVLRRHRARRFRSRGRGSRDLGQSARPISSAAPGACSSQTSSPCLCRRSA